MNEMYTHIATVSCRHQYFKDGLFKPLGFSIEENSVKVMKDLGIVLKQFSGGFHLLALDMDLLASEKNDKSLQLHFNCRDSYYINYTNLPNYSPGEDLLYFSNLNAQPASEEILSLHNGDFVESGDVVRLSHGQIKIPSFDPADTYIFLDASNESLPLDSIHESTLDPSEFSISNYRQGLVKIQSESAVVHKVYFQPKVVWKKPLGTIELFTATLSDHFKEKGNVVHYEINFNNRHTYWKYFLVDPVYQKFDALSIINKEKKPVFNSAQKQQIQENMDAIVFESINKLPLLEYSEHNFQLVDNYNADSRSGKVIIKNLVHASPEQLFLESPPSDEFIYSHIYI